MIKRKPVSVVQQLFWKALLIATTVLSLENLVCHFSLCCATLQNENSRVQIGTSNKDTVSPAWFCEPISIDPFRDIFF